MKNLSKKLDYNELKITMEDFEFALEEIKPKFGVSQDEVESLMGNEIIEYSKDFMEFMGGIDTLIEQVRGEHSKNLLSILFEGKNGVGKTTLAINFAMKSEFPFVKIISPEKMIGMSEFSRVSIIHKVFEDSYKSTFSVIVLDNIERLIDLIQGGNRFSNLILQALLVLIKKKPPKGRKLLIFGTTSCKDVLQDMEIIDSFEVVKNIPELTTNEIKKVLEDSFAFKNEGEEMIKDVLGYMPKRISIKKLQLVLEMCSSRKNSSEEKKMTSEIFIKSLRDCGCLD
jgi:vesicle-fusing ATPase